MGAGLLREPLEEYHMKDSVVGANDVALELALRLVSDITGKWMPELLLDRGIGASFETEPQAEDIDWRRLDIDFANRYPYV